MLLNNVATFAHVADGQWPAAAIAAREAAAARHITNAVATRIADLNGREPGAAPLVGQSIEVEFMNRVAAAVYQGLEEAHRTKLQATLRSENLVPYGSMVDRACQYEGNATTPSHRSFIQQLTGEVNAIYAGQRPETVTTTLLDPKGLGPVWTERLRRDVDALFDDAHNPAEALRNAAKRQGDPHNLLDDGLQGRDGLAHISEANACARAYERLETGFVRDLTAQLQSGALRLAGHQTQSQDHSLCASSLRRVCAPPSPARPLATAALAGPRGAAQATSVTYRHCSRHDFGVHI